MTVPKEDNWIKNAEHLTRLDEMLGLVDSDEMDTAYYLPVVAIAYKQLGVDPDTLDTFGGQPFWAIVSGERKEETYSVSGMYYGLSPEYFSGELSLDGSTLTLTNPDNTTVKVVFSSRTLNGKVSLIALNGENYGLFEPVTASDIAMRDAPAIIKRIKGGMTLYDAFFDGGEQSPLTARAVKGWLRAYRKQGIWDRHRDGFSVAEDRRALKYAPIQQEMNALNQEMGVQFSRVIRRCR
jgi:hypothetical protein